MYWCWLTAEMEALDMGLESQGLNKEVDWRGSLCAKRELVVKSRLKLCVLSPIRENSFYELTCFLLICG